MNRKAVIVGATGLVGKELLQLLLSAPAYIAITLLVRRPTGLTHPKLQEKVIDFELLEQSDVDLTGTDVFCTLGTTIKKAGTRDGFRRVDYDYPLTRLGECHPPASNPAEGKKNTQPSAGPKKVN